MTRLEHLDDIDERDDPAWTSGGARPVGDRRRGDGGLLTDGGSGGSLQLRRRVTWHAAGNIEPFSGAVVLSRGIVGAPSGRACIQTPIKKQAFAFDDGECLDDPSISVLVYRTRLTADGDVQVAA